MKNKNQTSHSNQPHQFEPVDPLRYTPIPDKFLDEAMPKIKSLAHLKTYLFVSRKTFGWKKDSDNISLSQIAEGTGLKLNTVKRATREMCENGLLVRRRNLMKNGEFAPSTYSLNIKGMSNNQTQGGSVSGDTGGSVSGDTGGSVSGDTYNKQTFINNDDVKKGKTKSSVQASPVVVSLLKKKKIGTNQIPGLVSEATKKIAGREDKITLQEYIEEKIAYQEFEQERNPKKAGNWVAWLIGAIKKDFAKPSGFKSKAEVEAEKQKQEAKIKEAEKQHKEYEAETRRVKLEAQEKAQRIENAKARAYSTYKTPDAQKQVWANSIQDQLDNLPIAERLRLRTPLTETFYLGHDDEKVYIFLQSDDKRNEHQLQPVLTGAAMEAIKTDWRFKRPEIVLLSEEDFEVAVDA